MAMLAETVGNGRGLLKRRRQMRGRFRSEGKFGIDFAAHFIAAKRAYDSANWRSCAKGGFRSCETPFEMVPRLRNGGSQGVEKIAANSQLRNGGTRLRNGTCVPRRVFEAMKIFAASARRLRNGFAVEINFRSEKRDFRSDS
uniref:Uncharacterized protein n=1 Tax=Vitis vinifera TaxID=29760 RepID=A5BXQ5_VITVI|nr:hypothetical protein VITISV_034396 [Vitis vinifera]